MRLRTCLVLLVMVLAFVDEARANIRGGGRVGGGVRAGAATSFRTPEVHRGYRPGIGAPGSAVFTPRHVAGRIARRTARGLVYYLGTPVVVLPQPTCYAVMWEEMTAYNCGGVIYIQENAQYYPVEGA